MLILDRKENQSIMIGNNVEITIVGIRGDHVKVGIQAPREIKVFRKEIYEEIQKSNIEAASTNINLDQLKSIGNLIKKKKDS